MLNKAKSLYPEAGSTTKLRPLSALEWKSVKNTVEKCIDLKITLANDLVELLGQPAVDRYWKLAAIRTSLCIRYCHRFAPALIPSITLLSMFKDLGVVRIQEHAINKRVVDGYLKLFNEDLFQFHLNAYESNFGLFYRGIESGVILEELEFDESIVNDIAKCTCRNIEFYAAHHNQRILICRQASLIAALMIHFSYQESIPSNDALHALLVISDNAHWKDLYKKGELYCQKIFDAISGENIDKSAADKAIGFLFNKPT